MELVANFELSEGQEFDAIFEINASGTTWGSIDGDIGNQTDLKNALDTKASNERVDSVVDAFDEDIENINSDITSIKTTINSYGDIVTYDAADFATSAQGQLADTALQPGNNITELNNNAGYITSSSLPMVNNSTITIQKNGSTVESFTLNQSNNETINITVPTQASDINAVPTSRTINGKSLSNNITLNASDVSALPSNTTINDLTTTAQQNALNSGATTTNIGQITTNANNISSIESLIPEQATSSNQLADKNFVNSSIATNTANFIGTFVNITELEAYSGTITNNDYAFVTNSVVTNNGSDWTNFSSLDAYNKDLLTNFDYAWVVNGSNFDLYRFDIVNQNWEVRVEDTTKTAVTLNTAYNRYKATVLNNVVTWEYEYTLNNSSFTASQWAAINSGITSSDVTLISTALQPGDNITQLVNNAGYTTNIGTVTSVNNTQPDANGNVTITIPDTATWGNITGTLSNQTDLQNALNAKQDNLTAANAGTDISITSRVGETVTVSGTNTITLSNAASNELNSVKLFGKCEQKDILPSEYQRVEYLESDGNSYIDTGIIADSEYMTYKWTGAELNIAPKSNSLFGSESPYSGIYYAYVSTGEVTEITRTLYLGIGNHPAFLIKNQAYIFNSFELMIKNGEASILKNGVLLNEGSYSGTVINGKNIYLFANNNAGNTQKALYRFKSFAIIKNNTLALNCIPCRRKSDSVLGMYDTVTGSFLINAGSGSFIAGADVTTPSPDNIMPIISNNGEIKVSGNLFNQVLFTTDVGSTITYTSFSIPNGTYTMSTDCPGSASGTTANVFFLAGQVTSGASSLQNGVYINNPITQTITDGYFTVAYRSRTSNPSYNPADYNFMLVKGENEADYVPYGLIGTSGTVETVTDSLNNTATAEMLLSIGSYNDEQEVLTGSITRNISVIILDGSEDWRVAGTNNPFFYIVIPQAKGPIQERFCTHLQPRQVVDTNNVEGFYIPNTTTTNLRIRLTDILASSTSIATFKSWLAIQYANGTPVTIVYPLETATTETVTSQSLTTKFGDNTLTASGSINDLSLEATYETQGGTLISFTNDTGYTTNAGTVTSVNNTLPDSSGNVTLNIPTPIVDQTYNASSTNAQSGVAIDGANFVQNKTTVADALSVMGSATTYQRGINIGTYSSAGASGAVAIGWAATTGQGSVSLGYNNKVNGTMSVGLGYVAGVDSGVTNAIQLGSGTNSTSNTFNVGFRNIDNYTLLDGTTGLIPNARIRKQTSISSSSTNNEIPSAKCVYDAISGKQDTLVSGTNIKTVNNTSLLGSGNIDVLQNVAQGTNSLSVLGTEIACIYNPTDTIVLGNNIGINSNCNNAILLGSNSNGLCIGGSTISDTFTVVSNSDYYKLLDMTTGLIPDARISKQTSISSSSTNNEIPSAKCVYDELANRVKQETTDTLYCWTIGPRQEYSVYFTSPIPSVGDNALSSTGSTVFLNGDGLQCTGVIDTVISDTLIRISVKRDGAVATPPFSRNSAGDISPFRTTLTDNNSNALNITQADGQWVAKFETLSTAAAIGTYTLDLSSYLPNDGYNYEVFIRYGCFCTSTSSAGCLSFSSDIITEPFTVAYAGSGGKFANGAFIIPVGAQRYITQYITQVALTAAADRFVAAYAYRRVGTNI